MPKINCWPLCRKKHHYLPKFYLNGFTNNSNKLFIYDKKRDVIKKGEYSTSTHFFEINRNSVEINGNLDDFAEGLYSKVDNTDKDIIKSIQAKTSPFSLTPEQTFQLQLFISNLFWRNPKIDIEYEKSIREKEPKENYFRVRNVVDGLDSPKEEIEEIRNFPGFIKSYKPSYGILKWLMSKNTLDIEKWRIAFNPKHNNIISDNPIIKFTKDAELFEDSFVLPLTKKFTLTRFLSGLTVKQLPPEFNLFQRIITIHQAEVYVACPEKEHLEQMVGLSKHFNHEIAKHKLFEILKECANS